MRVLNQLKYNQGITLLEIVITSVVIGILASLSFPSFLGMKSRGELTQATQTIQSTIQDAQKQAIRRGQICSIGLVATNPPQIQINRSDASCEIQDQVSSNSQSVDLPENVTFAANNLEIEDTGKLAMIKFNFKGQPVESTDPNKPAVIVLAAQGVNTAKCVVISPVIGLVRTGNYTALGDNPYNEIKPATGINIKTLSGNPENSCQADI